MHLASLKAYDAIICDINMPGIGGLEFLKKAKSITQTPIVLMTGFAELSDADQAFREGAKGFIAKPFKLADVKKVLESVTSQVPIAIEKIEPQNLDDDYFPLMIEEFLSGKKIKYDIFIRVNAQKYLKIAHCGENLEQGRVAKFKEKGVRVLYLRKEDYKHYISFLLTLNTKIAESASIEHEKKVKMLKLAGEVVLKGMFKGVMKDPELSGAKMIVNSVNRIVSEDEKLSDLLVALKSSGDALYTHAMGVSVMAVMMAHALKWTSQASVISVGLAGFFHDIGKKELPKALLEKSRLQYTPEDVELYETHPVRGANLLASIPKFPAEVAQSVLQHHESCSGVGFPKHLTRTRIIPIARLIAIADEFCEGLLEGPNHLDLSPVELLKHIKMLKADEFDHEYMKVLEELVNKN